MSKRIKKRKSKASSPDEIIIQKEAKEQLKDQSTFDHLRPENLEKAKIASQGSRSYFNLIVIVGFSFAIIVGLVLSGAFTGDISVGNDDDNQNTEIPTNTSGGTFSDITAVCINQDHSGLKRHDHFELDVVVFDNNFPFPDDVGRESSCWHVMHTHDTGNGIHLEVPNSWSGRNPNVGDFFSIFGQQFSDTNLMGTEGTLTMSINGNFRTNDFAGYQPSDGDVVVLTLT